MGTSPPQSSQQAPAAAAVAVAVAAAAATMERVPRCPVEKEFERKSAQEIMQSMEASKYTVDICNWGIRAFASISGAALLAQDTHALAEFLDDGGCEALVNVMNRHCDCSEIVALYGCLTVSVLAWTMPELKEFLGELGACEVVVYALTMHVGHPDISEFGTRAIYALARHNISNSFKLSAAGACEILVQVGNFGFNVRDDHAMVVALNTCLSIAYLSEALNAQRLHDFGAAALVTELSRFHCSDEEFAAAGVKAICALGSLSTHLREDLGKAGACKLLVEILNKHNITALQLEGCEAIMHMALNPNNADRLSASGACELVVRLGASLMDCLFGPEICTGAMLHLATYGVNAKENRDRLIRSNAIDQLKAAQFNVKASYKARENIQQLFDLLGSDASLRVRDSSLNNLVSVIHGSEMKGATIPLHVELREDEEETDGYESFGPSLDGPISPMATPRKEVLGDDSEPAPSPSRPSRSDSHSGGLEKPRSSSFSAQAGSRNGRSASVSSSRSGAAKQRLSVLEEVEFADADDGPVSAHNVVHEI